MTYLGMDITRGGQMVAALRKSTLTIGPTQQLLATAQLTADMPLDATLVLDAIENTLVVVATAIETAAARLRTFVVQPVVAISPVAPPPVSHHYRADDQLRWNMVEQDASHNSYEVDGGIAWLYQDGVRAFELDIHRGAPTDLTPQESPLARVHPALAIAVDHFDHRGGRPDDWRVYHVSGSAASEYEYLSDGLQVVAALPTNDPLTIFVDVKDDFGGTHTPDALDALVIRELGSRLYSPSDLIKRAPDSQTVGDAVSRAGWPTSAELTGRVLVVLTGEVDSYGNDKLFVAPTPHFDARDDQVIHLADPTAVFYNIPARRLSQAELAALQATTSVVRTYVNSGCDRTPGVNYRAVDVTPQSPSCR